MRGNFLDDAIMKVSSIDAEFQARFLGDPDRPGVFEVGAVVFEGPEDYRARIDDPGLGVAADSILIIRNCGPIGYPGGPEVVNMQPPAALLKAGIAVLPTLGDGRQSGTSGSPSILHVAPEAAIGGGLALIRTGDRMRIDIPGRRVDLLVDEAELMRRRAAWTPDIPPSQTPWQEIYRMLTGQLSTGAVIEPAVLYLDVIKSRGEARHSH